MKKFFLIFIAVIGFAFNFVVFDPMLAHADTTSGLVIHYTFSGNENDESGNGIHGLVNGATRTVDRFGNANSAYRFDGDDFILSSLNVGIANAEPRTISAWFKLASNDVDVAGIAGWGNGYHPSYLVPMVANSPQFGWWAPDIKSGVTPSLHTWYHFVFTYDGSVGMLFVNGNRIDRQNLILTTNDSPLKIGYTVSDRYFDGDIDDVRVYNRALSETDVQNLYLTEATIPLPGNDTPIDNIIFQDDFNRPDNSIVGNGWNEDESQGFMEISNNQLKMMREGGNYVPNPVLSRYLSTNPTGISFKWTEGEKLANGRPFFQLRNGTSVAMQILVNPNSPPFFWDVSLCGITDIPIALGGTYQVDIKNIDYSSHTFDFWVNGQEKLTSCPFINNVDTVDNLLFEIMHHGDRDFFHLDDFVLYGSGGGDDPDPPVCSPNDFDGDGVIDGLDICPNTPLGSFVDNVGCLATGVYTQVEVDQIVDEAVSESEAAKDFIIAGLNISIAVKDQKISDLEDDVETLEETTSDQEDEINSLNTTIEDQVETIDNLNLTIGDRELQIETLTEKLETVNQSIDSGIKQVVSDFRKVFKDAGFDVSGDSNVKELENLLHAIINLNKGRKEGLYKDLK